MSLKNTEFCKKICNEYDECQNIVTDKRGKEKMVVPCNWVDKHLSDELNDLKNILILLKTNILRDDVTRMLNEKIKRMDTIIDMLKSNHF